MSKRQLYVTEQAPNGCNDLLVVDENHRVIACLPEALFGVNIYSTFRNNQTRAVVRDDGCVWSKEYSGDDVLKVSLQTIDDHLAVSLVRSPEAAINRVLVFLNKSGVI